MLFERMLKHYLSYLQRCPQFALGNLKRLTGLQSPSINQDILHKFINYAVEAGFVTLPRAEPLSKSFANGVTKSKYSANQ